MNNIRISKNLKLLSGFFDQPIYLVGGYVRDSLLGYLHSDIDLAGAVLPHTIIENLKDSPFTVSKTSPKLMTLKISIEDEVYEYTTFREETYVKGHSPSKVVATESLKKDALRRDFKMNAVYCNIINGQIEDPLNGVSDIKNRIISTVEDAEKVFSSDGLRLMRLARMAGQLGFSVSEDTLKGAKRNCRLIDDIAPERIRDELNLILTADTVHNIASAHYEALLLLDRINVLERILPELTKGKGMLQREDFHKYDVFDHILHTVLYSDKKIRVAALFHDIGKPVCYENTGRYHGHEAVGKILTIEIMERLRYPKKEIDRTARLVESHMFNLDCKAKISTIRLFVQKNYDIIDDLVLLKKADNLGGGIEREENDSIKLLAKVYNEMRLKKVPFTISDLKVGGEDILALPPITRGNALNGLLKECALNDKLLDYAGQKNYLDKIIAKHKVKEKNCNGISH